MRAEEKLLKLASDLRDCAQKIIESAAIHEASAEDLKVEAESRIEEGS